MPKLETGQIPSNIYRILPKVNQIISTTFIQWLFRQFTRSIQQVRKPSPLTFKVLVWHWKCGQGHQNLIPHPNNVSVQVCWKSTNWFRRYGGRQEAMLTRTPTWSTSKTIWPPSPSVGGEGDIKGWEGHIGLGLSVLLHLDMIKNHSK